MKKLDGRSKRKSKSGSKFQHNSANVCIDGNDAEKKKSEDDVDCNNAGGSGGDGRKCFTPLINCSG